MNEYDEPIILARINGGASVPIMQCTCGKCKNEWFVPSYSDEWMPSYCPYCGIKFVTMDTDGEFKELKPRRPDEQ